MYVWDNTRRYVYKGKYIMAISRYKKYSSNDGKYYDFTLYPTI
jgi:hypothetical protein